MINKIKDFLIVKDNFFFFFIYNEILKDISKLKFNNRTTLIDKKNSYLNNVYQKIYFSVNLDVSHFAVKDVCKKLSEYRLNLSPVEHAYFLSTKHKDATPHADWKVDVNCLIYLKGEMTLNSGTGFYDIKNNNYELNRHVGFKENRAIIFDSKIFHASLQFNEGAKPRYVMTNFFKNKNKK